MIWYELYFNYESLGWEVWNIEKLVKTEGAIKDVVCAVDWFYQSPVILLLLLLNTANNLFVENIANNKSNFFLL